MQIKWTDESVTDLDEIESYIAEENSPLVAIDIVLRVIKVVEKILPDHPGAGRPGRVKGTREFVIDGIPFTAVYRQLEKQNQLQVLRVLHDA